MKIRQTTPKEIDRLLSIYDYARSFMQKTGNANQWINGYPSKEQVMADLAEKNSYVCVNEHNEVIATFYFKTGDDPTYSKIYQGEWLNSKPYGVVHRLASDGSQKGIAAFCLQWCFEQCKNIRVDTHHDNLVMQNILRKLGYIECGIIYVANGTERIAFQKTEKP
ncbi:GNAT family N-acetyltransferase [Parabacteroides sp. PF5-9]|uniref:GNAT family N-acetyltransferase n=1 Tax=Parabacteroides sp. PF5-9 TaxID=1742404 RepID=UPI00247566CC|nr:GNAT family N-acetyltransferase [Parabacteroides sp. PF5-9]